MKAIVLSSGGVDSTTCLGLAVEKFGADEVATISIFYGQTHSRELISARDVAKYYNVQHFEMDLSEVFKMSNSSLLTHSTQKIDHRAYSEQLQSENRVSTNVPFRNGVFLSAAASFADSFDTDEIFLYIGAHADDSAGNAYADCSEDFLKNFARAVEIGTYNKVKLVAPFAGKNKASVVAEGLRLNVPYELTWSCYESGEKPCGTCATCIDRKKAFELNGVQDPLERSQHDSENLSCSE